MIDYGEFTPALPSNPFTDVKSALTDQYYWSSTMNQNASTHKWTVKLDFGYLKSELNSEDRYAWPVRGGQ